MLESEDVEITMKVIVVGNGLVGKSSLIQQYGQGSFTDEYKKTIGVDFLERQININGEVVRLMLWDTAGQEEYDAITSAYYRGAQGCVIVYSVTDKNSFLAVRQWKKKVELVAGEDVVMVLVQNKIDLISDSVVTQFDAQEQAASLNMRLFQTSVKENWNIDYMFRYLAERCMCHVTEMAQKDSLVARPIGSLPASSSRCRIDPVKALRTVYNSVKKRHRHPTNGTSGPCGLRLADDSCSNSAQFDGGQKRLIAAIKCAII